MNTLRNLLRNLRNALCCIRQLLSYTLTFLWALISPKAVVAARLLAAESQLAAGRHRIMQKKAPWPRFTHAFRFLWVLFSKVLVGWQNYAHVMQPATVKRWHTMAFKYCWRWKSCKKNGRPPIPKDMQDLIQKLSMENFLTCPHFFHRGELCG